MDARSNDADWVFGLISPRGGGGSKLNFDFLPLSTLRPHVIGATGSAEMRWATKQAHASDGMTTNIEPRQKLI
ncbi:hypothetical protein PG999_001764 [Apiospora kogelbergensis]|uniref:Uncharacterized protein n=1 Tax=Apiospora kogelbergensis TaxID=1337665 RepID=A0AAW0R6B1_9PEZI